MQKERTVLTAKRKQEIELEAMQLADEYFPDTNPIKPELIAKAEGIKWTFNDYNRDFKGIIVFKNGSFHIHLDTYYGSNMQVPMVRYSLAHELGHYFLDEQRKTLIELGSMPHAVGNLMVDTVFEKEAEYFASCLLMPSNRFIACIAGHNFSTWLIHHICKTFKVSLTAALTRYVSLGEEPVMAIYTKTNGLFDYKMASKGFPHFNLNLQAGNKIPSLSIAGRYCYHGNADFKTNNILPAHIWFIPKTEANARRMYREECQLQQNLNRIISVVYEVKEQY